MGNIVRRESQQMRIAVWFDRPRDCLCFADRLDQRCKEGEAIPDDAIIRVPLLDGEDFIEAVMNAAQTETENFWKVMDGVQKLLDKRAEQAINLAEHLRLEWSKRADGITGKMSNTVAVRADEWIKNQRLRDKVLGMLADHEKKTAPRGGQIVIPDFPVHELQKFVEENKLDESTELPFKEFFPPELPQEEEGHQPGSGEPSSGPDAGKSPTG